MHTRYFLALGGCLVCAALVVAQNARTTTGQAPEQRTFAPTDDKQTVNRIPARVEYRSFTATTEGRAQGIGETQVRSFTDAKTADRFARSENKQYLNRDGRETGALHDTRFTKVDPGEKVNRLPETADRHNLADATTSRNLLPSSGGGRQDGLDRSMGGRFGAGK